MPTDTVKRRSKTQVAESPLPEARGAAGFDPRNPLIVQGDRTVLVEVDNPRYAEARDALAPFAELEKSPEHIHTYRLTPLSLWNAAAAGMTAEAMAAALQGLQVPAAAEPRRRHPRARGRYGRVRLVRRRREAPPGVGRPGAARGAGPQHRGRASTSASARRAERRDRADALPRRAEAGADHGRLPGRGPGRLHRGGAAAARSSRRAGLPFHVRDYQREAADVFYAGGDVRGGSGVIVLPCGAGKTIVGIAAMAAAAAIDADPDHQHHRRQAVAARDPRQDRP